MPFTRRQFAAMALAAACLPLPARASVPDQAQVLNKVQNFLNGITTMDARFVQLNHDGTTATGRFQLKRPQFARISYDKPPTVLVARGQRYMFWDAEIGQFYEGPVSASPASVLLHPNIDLSKIANILDVQRRYGELLVTLQPAKDPGAGILTLVFEENPMRLRQWFVKDAEGYVTRVTLTDVKYGVPLPDSLFDINVHQFVNPSKKAH